MSALNIFQLWSSDGWHYSKDDSLAGMFEPIKSRRPRVSHKLYFPHCRSILGMRSIWLMIRWISRDPRVTPGGCYNRGSPSLNSPEISIVHNLSIWYPIVMKFYRDHGNGTIVFCVKCQNEWATDMNVMDGWDFARFEFKLHFVGYWKGSCRLHRAITAGTRWLVVYYCKQTTIPASLYTWTSL